MLIYRSFQENAAVASDLYADETRIIHRDLVAGNCLLTHDLTLGISDFGISVAVQSKLLLGQLENVPVGWLSPETLSKGIINKKTVSCRMESTLVSTMADERVDGQEQNVRHCPVCPEICLALDTYCQHLLEHVNELTAQPLTTDVAICRDSGPSTSHREDSPEQAERSCQSINVGEIYQNVLLGQVILNWAQQFVTTRENQQSVVDRLIAPGSPIKSVRPDEKQFACNRCPFRAKSIQHLNSHENCHRDNKILFSCDICGAQFSQKSNLKRHSVSHQAGPMLTCVLCPRRFHRRDQMMEHVLSHWSDYRVIIRCPVVDCQESMDSRRDLKVHMRREHPGGEMHCSHCDKSYPGDKLVRHSLNVYATLFTAVIKRDPTTDPIHLDCTAPRPPEINGDEKAASVDHNHNDQENMDGKEI